MKTYTVIGGVNGVGKSSLSGVMFAKDLNMGTPVDAVVSSDEAVMKQINYCLSMGINFTVETDFDRNEIFNTILRSRDLGYFIRLYYVGINSLDESIERIQNRVKKGGHDIPTEDVKRRYNKRFEDLAKVLPYCSEAEFYDNENGFCEVAEYRNRSLIFTAKDIPAWLKEFSDLYL